MAFADEPLVPPSNRPRWLVPVLAAVVLIVGGWFLYRYMSNPSGRTRELAREQTVNLLPPPPPLPPPPVLQSRGTTPVGSEFVPGPHE